MATTSAPIQGVAAPDVVVDPASFYKATRRMRFAMSPLKAFSGLGATDSVQLRQVGIVAALELRVQGQLLFGGTIAGTSMTYDWPYNLIQNLVLSANGQSQLIACRGLTLKALNFATNPKIDDSGVSQTFGGSVVTTGTLALPTDKWGTSGGNVTAPGSTVAAAATYPFDLTFIVPVAADQVSLVGSIYAQSSATNLSLNITWATQSQIMTLGGAATIAPTVNWAVTGVAYSIPQVNNKFVVPDLSQFHQVAEQSFGGLVQGSNSTILPGTGVGRQLLRLLWNTYSGTAPATPLAISDANYSQVDWAYGGSDIPEQYPSGQQLRAENIQQAGVDLGGNWGIGMWDFASTFALRDSIDEGSTTNLRLEQNLVSSPTSGKTFITQELLFAAPVGA